MKTWVTPRTFVVGEIVTEAHLNEQLRDNLTLLGRTGIVAGTAYGTAHTGSTIPAWGYHCDVDARGGTVTLYLPSGTVQAQGLIEVRKTDSGAHPVNVIAAGTATINGGGTVTLYGQYESYSLRSDGLNVSIV